MILNGNKEWKEFNIGGGSSEEGSSLPSVTSEDNNKVLIVKNGEWTVDIAPAIVGSETEEQTGVYVYKLGTTPTLLNDGDTLEMSADDHISIAAFKHPYSSSTTPEDMWQLSAQSDNDVCNVSIQNKLVGLSVNDRYPSGTANVSLQVDYDIATYNLTVVCESI